MSFKKTHGRIYQTSVSKPNNATKIVAKTVGTTFTNNAIWIQYAVAQGGESSIAFKQLAELVNFIGTDVRDLPAKILSTYSEKLNLVLIGEFDKGAFHLPFKLHINKIFDENNAQRVIAFGQMNAVEYGVEGSNNFYTTVDIWAGLRALSDNQSSFYVAIHTNNISLQQQIAGSTLNVSFRKEFLIEN